MAKDVKNGPKKYAVAYRRMKKDVNAAILSIKRFSDAAMVAERVLNDVIGGRASGEYMRPAKSTAKDCDIY